MYDRCHLLYVTERVRQLTNTVGSCHIIFPAWLHLQQFSTTVTILSLRVTCATAGQVLKP